MARTYKEIHEKYEKDFLQLKKSIPEELLAETWMEQDVHLETDTSNSATVKFFEGKNILLTGATGFMGKALIEKLLRACPDLGNIYMLIRKKKDVEVSTRIEKTLKNEVFRRLKVLRPNFQEKLVGIYGDLGEPNLALSEQDRSFITKNVDIIFHAGATVNFNQKLHKAAHLNIRGTQLLLNLAKECTKLQGFIYISTAFSNCNRKQIDENVYKPHLTTKELFKLLENNSEEEIEKMLDIILKDFPNTYTFTKCLAEWEVAAAEHDIPVMIFRPSIILPTYREPIKSWTDNIYGPIGVTFIVALGIIHTVLSSMTTVSDIVPVDYVVNGLIVATSKIFKEKPKSAKVINFVQAKNNHFVNRDFVETNLKYTRFVPSNKYLVWHPSFYTIFNETLHKTLEIILQLLPALIIDGIFIITRQKQRVYPTVKKMGLLIEKCGYFMKREWQFENGTIKQLWKDTSSQDQVLFPFNMEYVNWDMFYCTVFLGVRDYFLHEKRETIPAAKRKYRILKYSHFTVKFVFLAICSYFVINYFY